MFKNIYTKKDFEDNFDYKEKIEFFNEDLKKVDVAEVRAVWDFSKSYSVEQDIISTFLSNGQNLYDTIITVSEMRPTSAFFNLPIYMVCCKVVKLVINIILVNKFIKDIKEYYKIGILSIEDINIDYYLDIKFNIKNNTMNDSRQVSVIVFCGNVSPVYDIKELFENMKKEIHIVIDIWNADHTERIIKLEHNKIDALKAPNFDALIKDYI